MIGDDEPEANILHRFIMHISYTDTLNIMGDDVVFISIDLEIWEPSLNFRGKITDTRVSEYRAIGDIPFSSGATMLEQKMNGWNKK